MKRVCALGFFDGVHLGHAAIIKTAVEIAKAFSLSPAVVTFDKKPKSMNVEAAGLLNDTGTKKEIIRRLFPGIEIIEIEFTDKLKNTCAHDFTENYLKQKLNAAGAVVGEDFRFGKKAGGTPELLSSLLNTEIVKTVRVEQEIVSSTAIRTLLADGNINKANSFLGHPHIVAGEVSHGDARGRRLGCATVNLIMGEGIVKPKPGVYATKTYVDGRLYDSVTNFGVRPTFCENGEYVSETHIFHCEDNLYGKKIKLLLFEFLRPEIKFSTPDELKKVIETDIENAKKALKALDKQNQRTLF